MKKKFKFTTLITCLLVFLATLCTAISLYVIPVKAAGSVFEVEYGAGVKLTENGLRFKVKMDETTRDYIVQNDDVSLYGYITYTEELDKAAPDYVDIGTKVGGAMDESKIYEDGGYYYANIAMTNLTTDTYSLQNTAFSAFFYYQDANGITYAELARDENGVPDLEMQSRTQYEVVNKAMLDGENSYEERLNTQYGEWYGTEEYPIYVSNADEYTALADKTASASSVFANKAIYLTNGITDSQSLGATAGKHIVSYYDGYKLLDMQFVADGNSASAPADPTRDGYEFVEWVGDSSAVNADRNIYAKWKAAKGDVKDLGNLSVYGVTLAGGGTIANDSDVIGKKVILASGDLGDGAYYPGETDSVPDSTDENNTADQAYLAYDGSYGFNDYFVADFTGKNMPTLAFFANNYNNSIFYGDGTKNGVVVSTGLTWPDGRLFTEDTAYCTSVFNGQGLCMWGPHMIYSTAKNCDGKGVLLHSNVTDVALGRANLVDGTKYRVIMGMQPGDDASNKAIKLVYNLYNLDTNELVESQAFNTYNFFADGWANAGQTRDEFCVGSIVAYGYFGTTTVLDKTYGIYEDTTINAIAQEMGMETNESTTVSGDSIVLGAGSIGAGANYTIGQNAGGSITQAYYALNGNYDFDDYVVFDFTGKNMPEVMFFAENYDTSMYYSAGKQGVVVASGITLWDGSIGSAQTNNTKVGVSGPFGAYYQGAAAPYGGNMLSDFEAKLARANLDDSKQYRMIMGFTKGANNTTFKLNYMLYNLTDNVLVEEVPQESWAFFTGSNEAVNNMTLDDLSGSIVLYGKFNTTCTIDKLYGVYENTTIAEIANELVMNTKTVTFQNYDGTELQKDELSVGMVPEYVGATPVKAGDAVFASYEFTGWDKELTAVTDSVTYTAVFTGTARENVTLSTSKAVTASTSGVVLTAGNLGNGANYVGPNANDLVDQAYLAFDGNYGLGDYLALDFTGKNMPEIAFFAQNYNNSMYYQYGDKQGILVASGITMWNGTVYTGTEILNGSTRVNITWPFMANNDINQTNFTMNSVTDSKLARANLVDGTQYRVIIGFASGSDHGANGITLQWNLYNRATGELVESESIHTYAFFTGSNSAVNNLSLSTLLGSIVLYGKFNTATTLDKVWGVFEDTTLDAVAAGLNGSDTYTVNFEDGNGNVLESKTVAYGEMPAYTGDTPNKASDLISKYTFSGWDKAFAPVGKDVTYYAQYVKEDKDGITQSGASISTSGEGVALSAGSIGSGANYTKGQNAGGSITQSYLAFDGEYSFNDYIVFDFTGKNMPEIMFFAKNYDTSMYYSEGKQGIVVASGITLWDGSIGSAQTNNTKVGVSGPFGAYFEGAAAPYGGNMLSDFAASLARANLVDGTQYRIIMGFENNGTTFTLKYMLYDVNADEVVETVEQTSWAFFTGANDAVNNMTLEGLSGSIVLYGKFNATCTVDKFWGIYEDTTLEDVAKGVLGGDDSGSGDSGESEPSSNAPDYSGYTDTFDFYAYSCYSDGTYEIDGEKYYVGKNLATLKQYAQYGEAGMTIYFPQSDCIISDDAATVTKAKALIDDLAKVGIYKTILQDNRILHLSMKETAIVGSGCEYADEAALDAFIYNCLKDYATYPGVYGVQLGDEPKYSMLSAYAAVYNSIKRVCAANGWDLHIQYNLNPLNVTEEVYTNYYPASSGTYAWGNYRYTLGIRDRFTDCVTRYTQYINDFLDAMNPDSIMYDDYPIREDKNGNMIILDSYIPCLQIVAKAAADRGIKFYNVTQSHENNADGTVHKREITEAGAKWLNNILIGFGAKQIAYYTYYTRSESDSTGGESYVDGSSFVDYNGNPTDLYYTMKKIHTDNQIFASTVLQFDYVGSRTYGSADHFAEVTVSNSFAKLSNFTVSTGGALVTELYDDENGNYMYMAMNVLDPDASETQETLTLTFNDYTHALVYRDGVFTEVALDNHVLTVTANPGEAAFVIPYN